MFLITVLLAIAAIIWGIIAFRFLTPAVNGLLVILTGIVLGHSFYNQNVGPLPLTIDRVLWGLMLLHFVLMLRSTQVSLKSFSRTDLVVVLLAAVLVVSTFSGDWSYRENRPLSRLLFFNLMPIGIYFVTKQSRLLPRDLTFVFALLALFGVYIGFTGIAEQQGFTAFVFPRFILDPNEFEFLGRARGPFLNPVSCGIYLVICAVATLFIWPRCQLVGRTFLVGLVAVMLAATFLTLTRSVWLSAAVSMAFVVWFAVPQQLRGGLVIGGTLAIVVGMALFGDRLGSFKRDRHVTESEMAQSITLRPVLAKVAWNMFKDRPLTGHGFGQYSKYKTPYHHNDTGQMPLQMALPYMQHNVFLSYLTETGLIGFGLLTALLLGWGVKSWRLWAARHRALAQRQVGLLAIVVLLCYCINGMFHDVSIIPHVGAILFFVAGLVENLSSQKLSVNAAALPPTAQPDDMRIAA